MIFRLFIFLSLIPAYAVASSQMYEMMPGQYSVKAEASDTVEVYPIDIKFTIGELGELAGGTIDYPTYNCKAKIVKFEQNGYQVSLQEKMLFGYDTCTASTYSVNIIKNKAFVPLKREYATFHTYDDGKKVELGIISYLFKPTQIAIYRTREKAATIDDLLSTTDSNILRYLIKSSSHNNIREKSKNTLIQLIELENSKFREIIGSDSRKDLTDYLSIFPGSPHLANVKTKIQILDYRAKRTLEGFYAAYLLSHENCDVTSLLTFFGELHTLRRFLKGKPDIRKNELVKNKIAGFYRVQDSFKGYMQAFKEAGSYNDITSAYQNVISNKNTTIINDESLLFLFCTNFVTSLSQVEKYTLFIERTNYATANNRYNGIIGQDWFRPSIKLTDFLSSVEYEKVLRYIRPLIDIEHDGETTMLQVKYPKKNFTFKFNGQCQYDSQYNQIEDTGFFADGLAVTQYAKKRVFYQRDKCELSPTDFTKITTLENGILGRSLHLNESWNVDHFISKEYLKSGSSTCDSIIESDNRGLSTKTYSAICTGGSYGTITWNDGTICASGNARDAKCKASNQWTLHSACSYICQ